MAAKAICQVNDEEMSIFTPNFHEIILKQNTHLRLDDYRELKPQLRLDFYSPIITSPLANNC
jgi:hypothetical protein